MIKNILLVVILILLTPGLTFSENKKQNTSSPVVISKAACHNLAGTSKPFILVLDRHDDLLVSITQCAQDAKLTGASITGLGQVYDPQLAYLPGDPSGKPTVATFSGYHELASFMGNISVSKNFYLTHAHAVLADKEFHGIAGHLKSAKVGSTVEITIIPLSGLVDRAINPKTGFGPLVH